MFIQFLSTHHSTKEKKNAMSSKECIFNVVFPPFSVKMKKKLVWNIQKFRVEKGTCMECWAMFAWTSIEFQTNKDFSIFYFLPTGAISKSLEKFKHWEKVWSGTKCLCWFCQPYAHIYIFLWSINIIPAVLICAICWCIWQNQCYVTIALR